MANKKLLSEAIEAFINRDEVVAAKKLRAFFVESAQEINKKMEEDFDADAEAEGEDLAEDLNQDPNETFAEDVGFKLDEQEEDEGEFQADEFEGEGEGEGDFAPEVGAEEDAAGEVEKPEGVEPQDWQSIKDAMSGLEALFAEIYNGQEEGEEVAADEAEVAGEEEAEAGDDFADVEFGDEKFGESFKMKNVPAVDKTEKGDVQKKAAGVPGNAKPAAPGVKPAMPGNNTEKVNDKSFDNKQHDAVKVEDHGNILTSDKEVQKPAKAPKAAQKPASTKSGVPARK